MQNQPPSKPKEANISVTVLTDDGTTALTEGATDHNGIITGRWKTGLFGFMDSIVPNGVMSCCCPAVTVAQIAARIGVAPFNHVLFAFAPLYLLAFLSVVTYTAFWTVLFYLAAIIAVLCCMRLRWRVRSIFSIPGSPCEDILYALCCGCCSIAQMASHVESYEPGVYSFAPRETLQGYSFQ